MICSCIFFSSLSSSFFCSCSVMDTEYLRAHLGVCLTECLAEVCEKRPKDPIEFIAQWLYKYLDNVNYAKEVQYEYFCFLGLNE